MAKQSRSRALTLVGTGRPGDGPDGTITPATAIAEPFGVVIGPDALLYFCDLGNHRIRCIDPASGVMHTVAGTGTAGYSGDGGPAANAQLDQPYELRLDPQGNLVFVDMPTHVIRRIAATTGVIETIAGQAEPGFGGDAGPARHATFRQPHSIEIDDTGAIYIADIGNHRVRCIDPVSGIISTIAGTGEPAPTTDGARFVEQPLHGPRSLAFDERGDLYLTLREGNAVYRLNRRRGTIHHIAGIGQRPGYGGDGGPATAALLGGPKGIAVLHERIYIADTESHTIRQIDRRSGVIETVLGTGAPHDGPDGDPLTCGLARPHGVCIAPDGTVYVGDSDNHRVRAITT